MFLLHVHGANALGETAFLHNISNFGCFDQCCKTPSENLCRKGKGVQEREPLKRNL